MKTLGFGNSGFACLIAMVLTTVAHAQPGNDICSSAIDLQEFLPASQSALLAGPFSNEGATGNDLDIATVTGCWLDDLTGNADGSSPQVDATIWFRLQGWDGVLMLYVQPCDSNLTFLSQDTQMVLYSGECDSLQWVSCNEDINSAQFNYWSGITTPIQANTTYYLAIDGFNYSGFGSPELPLTTGEFCLSFTQPAVGVRQLDVAECKVYPNPTRGKIQLSSDTILKEIAVFNSMGEECVRLPLSNTRDFELELPYSSGIYTLLVRSEMGISVHRIIKNE